MGNWHYYKYIDVTFVFLCFLAGEKIPNCTEQILRETSLQKAVDIEKMLLSLPPTFKTYPLWIDHDKVTGQKYVSQSLFIIVI